MDLDSPEKMNNGVAGHEEEKEMGGMVVHADANKNGANMDFIDPELFEMECQQCH